MNFKLPYGLKDGNTLVHISEVDSGLKCNCVCPSCHHPLVARKGTKTAHHFAHYKEQECEYGLETALHLAAKEILEKQKKIVIPDVILQIGADNEKVWMISEEKEIVFDKIELETYHQGIVPDVVVFVQGKPLMIEITVTHKTGEEKIQRVREQGISILEINLEHFQREFSLADLEKEVIYNTSNKIWLLNIMSEKVKSLIYQISERKKYSSCSLYSRDAKEYKYFLWNDDCKSCKYCLGIEQKFLGAVYDRKGYPEYMDVETIVLCSGKNRIGSFDDLIHFLRKK